MKAKYIISFFLLVLLLGAIGYLPSFLSSYGLLDWPAILIVIFTIIGGGSPTFAALITTRLESGKQALPSLFKQFNPRHVSWIWFVVAIGLPAAIALCVAGLWRASGNAYPMDEVLLAQAFPLLVSNFALNMWEEVGWRGYAFRTLQKKHSALIATLITGIVWAVWHWPLFFMAGSQLAANYHNSYPLFVATTLAVSVIYAWLYNSSAHNLMVVSLFHAASNSANTLLLAQTGIAYDASVFYFSAVAVLAVVLIGIFKPRYLIPRKESARPGL